MVDIRSIRYANPHSPIRSHPITRRWRFGCAGRKGWTSLRRQVGRADGRASPRSGAVGRSRLPAGARAGSMQAFALGAASPRCVCA